MQKPGLMPNMDPRGDILSREIQRFEHNSSYGRNSQSLNQSQQNPLHQMRMPTNNGPLQDSYRYQSEGRLSDAQRPAYSSGGNRQNMNPLFGGSDIENHLQKQDRLQGIAPQNPGIKSVRGSSESLNNAAASVLAMQP